MNIESLYTKNRRNFIFKIKPYVKEYDIAEDIVQEAFSRALTKIETYDRNKGSLKGWFTKILFSCLWDYMRERKRIPPLCDIDLILESELLSYEETPNLRDFVNETRNILHKKVLVGYLVLGNTYKEIAAVTGMTQHNTRKIVQRFRDGEKLA